MTVSPPDAADAGGSSALERLDRLDDTATDEHLAVYTAIAGELAARLDDAQEHPSGREGERG
jgi:hypothetical protein